MFNFSIISLLIHANTLLASIISREIFPFLYQVKCMTDIAISLEYTQKNRENCHKILALSAKIDMLKL